MSIRHCIRSIEERLLCRGNGCFQFFSVNAADPCEPTTGLWLERLNSISFVFAHEGHSAVAAQAAPDMTCITVSAAALRRVEIALGGEYLGNNKRGEQVPRVGRVRADE